MLEAQIMGHSFLMKTNRDEQRDEIMRKTPGKRVQVALDLSAEFGGHHT